MATTTTAAAPTIIIPPPEIKQIVDKTAQFVARNGQQFEHRIAQKNQENAKFGFLVPSNPYHAFYRKLVNEYTTAAAEEEDDEDEEVAAAVEMEDEEDEQQTTSATATTQKMEIEIIDKQEQQQHQQQQITAVAAPVSAVAVVVVPDRDPLPYVYGAVPIPRGIDPAELSVIKLTAQYSAINGPQFVNVLAGREASNSNSSNSLSSQYLGFLRVTHMYHSFFVQLTQVYKSLLLHQQQDDTHTHIAASAADAENGGGDHLHQAVAAENGHGNGKFDDSSDGSSEKLISMLRFNAEPRNRLALLDTIHRKSLWDSAQQERKRRQEREEMEEQEALSTIDWYTFVVVETIDFGREELLRPTVAAQPSAIAMQVEEEEEAISVPPPPPVPVPQPVVVMQEDEEDDDEMGQIRVVKNYKRPSGAIAGAQAYAAPTAAAAASASAASGRFVKDPISGELIPVEQASEHLRVQLIDRQWREQKKREMKKFETTNIAPNADIASNLMAFASRRSKTVNPQSGATTGASAAGTEEDEGEAAERVTWDGHYFSMASTTAAAMQQRPVAQQQHRQVPQYGPQSMGPAASEEEEEEQLPASKRQRQEQ